jgi:hypothetical protein
MYIAGIGSIEPKMGGAGWVGGGRAEVFDRGAGTVATVI